MKISIYKPLSFLLIAVCILWLGAAGQSGKPEQRNRYKIIGSVTGFADSTLLYLDDLTDGSFRHVDSTYIMGGNFEFTGSIKPKTLRVAIRTKDISNRRYLWLENTTIYITGDKAKFREAVITGSKTQEDDEKLRAWTKDAKNSREQEIAFVRNNPASIVSAYLLDIYATTWGKDTAEMLYRHFTKEVKNTLYGQRIQEFLNLNKNIQIGGSFIDFSQPDTKGQVRKLSDFKGKVVLLEFWGSWCGPCRRGNPELVKIYNEFNGKGFEIFGVGAETSKSEWLRAVKEDGLPWTNVSDLNGDKNKAALIYGVSYYPTNFLIDKNGKIVARDLKGEDLRAKLRAIL